MCPVLWDSYCSQSTYLLIDTISCFSVDQFVGQEAGRGAGRGVAVTSNSGLHYSSGGGLPAAQHQLQLPQFPSPAGHQYLNNGHQVGLTSSEASYC